jgi:hypothetical protein
VTDGVSLHVSVLGPLTVIRAGVTVRPGRGRAGVLLAVLAMSAGRSVSTARLAGLIWDDDQPEHSRASLHTVVTRLRGIVPGAVMTALAVRAAHRLAGRFVDGQLFIDLHGYTQGYPPRTAGQALETFLRALGVTPQQIPGDTEERAALYRERLAGTRTLIVLDNAADEAQVRPPVPGGPGCLVLITSRRKLKSLDDAHVLALDALPEPDAVALLRAAPTTLGAFSDGDRDLAAVFGLSDYSLGDDQRRLYRYLGLMPGPEIDAYATAALADTDPAAAERLLQELVDHNLLLEPAAGRYRMHDLIRAHGRAQAASEPAGEREAALSRLFCYYQHTALRADARIARYARHSPARIVAR